MQSQTLQVPLPVLQTWEPLLRIHLTSKENEAGERTKRHLLGSLMPFSGPTKISCAFIDVAWALAKDRNVKRAFRFHVIELIGRLFPGPSSLLSALSLTFLPVILFSFSSSLGLLIYCLWAYLEESLCSFLTSRLRIRIWLIWLCSYYCEDDLKNKPIKKSFPQPPKYSIYVFPGRVCLQP